MTDIDDSEWWDKVILGPGRSLVVQTHLPRGGTFTQVPGLTSTMRTSPSTRAAAVIRPRATPPAATSTARPGAEGVRPMLAPHATRRCRLHGDLWP